MQLLQISISMEYKVEKTFSNELVRIATTSNDFLLYLRMRLDIVINISTNVYKVKFNTHQANATISFKFLGINLGKRTSCYNLYRNIKVNANKLSVNNKTSGKAIRLIPRISPCCRTNKGQLR